MLLGAKLATPPVGIHPCLLRGVDTDHTPPLPGDTVCSAGNGFLLVWGATFGGIPLLFGLSMGVAWFVALQLAIFGGAIVAVALFYEQLRDLYRHPGMFMATFGLVFFVIGAALAVTLSSDMDKTGLLVGLIFAGVGGLLLLGGVWALVKK